MRFGHNAKEWTDRLHSQWQLILGRPSRPVGIDVAYRPFTSRPSVFWSHFEQAFNMHIGVPQERQSGETRVAATPETVKKLVALGHRVTVATHAGAAASFTDAAF